MSNVKRLVIHINDVMILIGISERSAYRLLTLIREHYKKKPMAYITIHEFCAYTGLDKKDVQEYLD